MHHPASVRQQSITMQGTDASTCFTRAMIHHHAWHQCITMVHFNTNASPCMAPKQWPADFTLCPTLGPSKEQHSVDSCPPAKALIKTSLLQARTALLGRWVLFVMHVAAHGLCSPFLTMHMQKLIERNIKQEP
eukprot:1158273-Pelagomonas_calceolata.AAC.6